jgi:uncharacterized membrane protein YraQ (UPF0718 family)
VRNLKENTKELFLKSGKLLLGKATTSQFIALLICLFVEWKFAVEIDYIASNFIAITIGVMYNYLKMDSEEKQEVKENTIKLKDKLIERAKILLSFKDQNIPIEFFDNIDLNFTKFLSGEKNGEKEGEKTET